MFVHVLVKKGGCVFSLMTLVYDLQDMSKPLRNPVLTIGNFDGVHKGHLALFEQVKQRAKAISGQSAVMTFDPHPVKVMRPGNGPPLITPTKQKLELIDKAGIEVIFCLPFTKSFAKMSAREFVENILVNNIGVREIVVGYDYAFGADRDGNIELLQEMGTSLGFVVHVLPPVYVGGNLVSSTYIRKLIQDGNLNQSRELLGRDYQIYGTVVSGKNRGARLLGYPTANLKLVDELTPKRGTYAVEVVLDDRKYDGVANIGYNPTFGEGALSVETHVLDFSGDLLGMGIRVNFIERLRDEKSFGDVKELSNQIDRDIKRAKEILRLRRSDNIPVEASAK